MFVISDPHNVPVRSYTWDVRDIYDRLMECLASDHRWSKIFRYISENIPNSVSEHSTLNEIELRDALKRILMSRLTPSISDVSDNNDKAQSLTLYSILGTPKEIDP